MSFGRTACDAMRSQDTEITASEMKEGEVLRPGPCRKRLIQPFGHTLRLL